MNSFDATIIIGGGITKEGQLPDLVKTRLEYAIQDYKGEHIICQSAYTFNKPPVIDAKGFPCLEAELGAKFLTERGIPKEKIFMEPISKDTLGAMYFTRILHTDVRGWCKLNVITSDFHMPRVKALTDWIYALTPLEQEYSIHYIEAPTIGMAPDILAARKEKESNGIKLIEQTKKGISSLADLHEWLYREHAAYAVNVSKPKEFYYDEKTLKSY